MKLDEFDYELDADRIAQHPAAARDGSRLIVLRRLEEGGETPPLEHAAFRDIGRFLNPGDLLVVNDTRVLPARLIGKKATGGRIEILLVEEDGTGGAPAPMRRTSGPAARDGSTVPSSPGAREEAVWTCLAGYSRAPSPGSRLDFGPDLEACYLGRIGEETHRVRLRSAPGVSLREALARSGRVPLPPYIQRSGSPEGAREDRERYQTIFAEREGAIAAPTAGLHFTRNLLASLTERGIGIARITLHVGPATFTPVRAEEIEDHPMPAERYEVPRATVEAFAGARSSGGRIVAIGTTVVRALESASDGRGGIVPARGRTDLFIHPGHRFRSVDALVTNFHLPRSTLLVLVAAFAGRDRILNAYREAIAQGYRFYSYGDAMLIL